MKLLLVEDELELCNAVRDYLQQAGHLCETANDYFQAEEKISLYDYDCILLDITLPGGSGLDLLKLLKQNKPDAALIIISAKNSLDDKISGLNLGADDYLTKPFHLSELNARINALVRRKQHGGENNIVGGEIEICPAEITVFVNKKEILLTRKEFELLLYLVANHDKVVTRESIAEHLWGESADSADTFDFIYSHIKNLRKKIAEQSSTDYIQSVYGIGYKFSTT